MNFWADSDSDHSQQLRSAEVADMIEQNVRYATNPEQPIITKKSYQSSKLEQDFKHLSAANDYLEIARQDAIALPECGVVCPVEMMGDE